MEMYVEDRNGDVGLYDPASEGSYWYVMTTPRNKALRVKEFLAENSIEAIVPLHYQDVVRRGKSSRELVSALDDFVYICADLEKMRWIKQHLPFLTYVKEESFSGKMIKYRVYIENEIVGFFRLLEQNYLDDIVIVSQEDVWDDDFTQINTQGGIFKDIPIVFENVKGVDHKCLTMILNYETVVAVKSLTPESFMTQECVMTQFVGDKIVTTTYPSVGVV